MPVTRVSSAAVVTAMFDVVGERDGRLEYMSCPDNAFPVAGFQIARLARSAKPGCASYRKSHGPPP